MLQSLEQFIRKLTASDEPERMDADEVALACAALLIRCAKADGYQSPEEDAKIREILARRFSISGENAEGLIALAGEKEAEALDTYRFTRVLHRQLDAEARKEIVGLLWEMTHADGDIDYDERSAVTLAASLLHVEIRDAVALRRAVVSGSE